MPTPTWERLGPDRREAVVKAAETEFAAKGFSGGSLNVIARDAGVAKGSLFQYFHDKGDLYEHLVGIATVRIRADMEGRIADLDWGNGFFESLRTLFELWMDYFAANPVDRAITAATNLEHEPEALARVRQIVNPHYMAVLEPLVGAGVDAGTVRSDADTEAFLALLILVLPHLALAPHHEGLDPILGLAGSSARTQSEAAGRLVDVFRRAFGVASDGGSG